MLVSSPLLVRVCVKMSFNPLVVVVVVACVAGWMVFAMQDIVSSRNRDNSFTEVGGLFSSKLVNRRGAGHRSGNRAGAPPPGLEFFPKARCW